MYDPDLDFPYVTAPRRPSCRLSGRELGGLILAIGLAMGLLVLFVAEFRRAREACRRADCIDNLCGIALALHNYHSDFGSLPPAHIDDANGRPMHSWRVLILPYLEHKNIYNMYNFNEPWSSPGNSKVLKLMPNIYNCPSRHDLRNSPTSLTSFVFVVGPGTAFPGGGMDPLIRIDGGYVLADVKQGFANRILMVEVDNVAIPWTEPRDLDVRTMSFQVNDPMHPGISSPHAGGAHVRFGAESSGRFQRQNITPEDLRALLTISGGERNGTKAASSNK